MAAKFDFVDLIEFSIPSGKDGFLATSSLFASAVLLIRLYSDGTDLKITLPSDFHSLLSPNLNENRDALHAACLPLWAREHPDRACMVPRCA